MNATVSEVPVLQDIFPAPDQCTETLHQINESLLRREALLAASAQASRLLLEKPDVRAAVPDVLRLIGEAAGVDRVSLLLSQLGPDGEPLLVVVVEWAADGVAPSLGTVACRYDERRHAAISAELRGGRTVCLSL